MLLKYTGPSQPRHRASLMQIRRRVESVPAPENHCPLRSCLGSTLLIDAGDGLPTEPKQRA